MTNMQVDWQSSFLEAIGPLAGIADPVTAIAKLSADAKMTAEAIYWTMCHAALFVFVVTDLLAQVLVMFWLLSMPLVTGDGMPGTSIENDNWRL